MNRFKELLTEAPTTSNAGLMDLILNRFYAATNNPNSSNERKILLLVAAMAVLNSGSNDSRAIGAARKLFQAAGG